MFDAQQIEPQGERSRGEIGQRQAAGADRFFTLQDRAMLVERAELRGQVVQVRAEQVRLELAGDAVDDFAEPKDVLGQGDFLRLIESDGGIRIRGARICGA